MTKGRRNWDDWHQNTKVSGVWPIYFNCSHYFDYSSCSTNAHLVFQDLFRLTFLYLRVTSLYLLLFPSIFSLSFSLSLDLFLYFLSFSIPHSLSLSLFLHRSTSLLFFSVPLILISVFYLSTFFVFANSVRKLRVLFWLDGFMPVETGTWWCSGLLFRGLAQCCVAISQVDGPQVYLMQRQENFFLKLAPCLAANLHEPHEARRLWACLLKIKPRCERTGWPQQAQVHTHWSQEENHFATIFTSIVSLYLFCQQLLLAA